MATAKTILIGQIAEVGGVGAVVVGVVLSLRHWGIALALIGGIAAYVTGKKLRGQTL
jgi:hypothetical protein